MVHKEIYGIVFVVEWAAKRETLWDTTDVQIQLSLISLNYTIIAAKKASKILRSSSSSIYQSVYLESLEPSSVRGLILAATH